MRSKKKTKAVSKKPPRTQSPAKKASKTGDTKRARISVLIADDHSVVREGLVSLITRKADMTVIGEAGNGREAVDLWKQPRMQFPAGIVRKRTIICTAPAN